MSNRLLLYIMFSALSSLELTCVENAHLPFISSMPGLPSVRFPGERIQFNMPLCRVDKFNGRNHQLPMGRVIFRTRFISFFRYPPKFDSNSNASR